METSLNDVRSNFVLLICYDLLTSRVHSVHNNPSKKRRYTKTLFKPEEFENAGFMFSCGKQKYFENGALRTKRWRHDNYVISLTEICPNTNPKWPLTDVDWKHLMGFRVRFLFLNSFGLMWTGPMTWVILYCTQKAETVQGVSNGPIQFESVRKIWPLLALLTKIRCVLACSRSQKFCKCLHARIFVKIPCRVA